MAKKAIYGVTVAAGIAAALAGAWWVQNKPNTAVGGAQAVPTQAGAPQPGASGPARPPGVEVAKVKTTQLQDDAQAVGTLKSRQSVMLRPEVAGRVSQIAFADGARVKKGQVLIQLDDVLQRAELSQAQAQVSIARANLKRNQ
ncbi:MAG: hypothetical protein RJA09_2258, partial [Pseudomonadota bacterium]